MRIYSISSRKWFLLLFNDDNILFENIIVYKSTFLGKPTKNPTVVSLKDFNVMQHIRLV